jgi:SPP1 family predicted phage head-tail adaptor
VIDRVGKKSLATEARHRVTIQTLTQTADGEGGFTDTWADTQTVWAAIYPMSAAQMTDYNTVGVDANITIKIRGKIAVGEKQRIKFGTRIFEIKTVEDAQERGFVKYVICKERR